MRTARSSSTISSTDPGSGAETPEHAAHRAEDVGEADAALEEGLDGDFIGGVEDDGRAVVGGQRIVGGLKKREGLRVGLLEGQPTDFGRLRRFAQPSSLSGQPRE